MRYLFELYFAYKKQIKSIFDFIKYWLFILIFAFYIATIYTYGINYFALVLFVIWLGFLSNYIVDAVFLIFKKLKRGKKNESGNKNKTI